MNIQLSMLLFVYFNDVNILKSEPTTKLFPQNEQLKLAIGQTDITLSWNTTTCNLSHARFLDSSLRKVLEQVTVLSGKRFRPLKSQCGFCDPMLYSKINDTMTGQIHDLLRKDLKNIIFLIECLKYRLLCQSSVHLLQNSYESSNRQV